MRFALVMAILGALSSAPAHADVPEKAAKRIQLVDAPCAGCRASFPSGTDPVPLLVILHGDWGYGPAELVRAWERHAASRGVALLALSCPRDLGCKGSWWQWNGDPSWITAQVDAFAAKRSIDRQRTWLAGWSGGASYIGMRAQSFQRAFAALVYHGGGIPPSSGECANDATRVASRVPPSADPRQPLTRVPSSSVRAAPVYFLVGTGNPLHSLAVRLRDHHDRCNDELVWKALPGAAHPAEWAALDANAGAIVDWLLTKRTGANGVTME